MYYFILYQQRKSRIRLNGQNSTSRLLFQFSSPFLWSTDYPVLIFIGYSHIVQDSLLSSYTHIIPQSIDLYIFSQPELESIGEKWKWRKYTFSNPFLSLSLFLSKYFHRKSFFFLTLTPKNGNKDHFENEKPLSQKRENVTWMMKPWNGNNDDDDVEFDNVLYILPKRKWENGFESFSLRFFFFLCLWWEEKTNGLNKETKNYINVHTPLNSLMT